MAKGVPERFYVAERQAELSAQAKFGGGEQASATQPKRPPGLGCALRTLFAAIARLGSVRLETREVRAVHQPLPKAMVQTDVHYQSPRARGDGRLPAAHAQRRAPVVNRPQFIRPFVSPRNAVEGGARKASNRSLTIA